MDFNRGNFDHLLETHGALSSENEQLKMDNKQLKERIQYLLRKLFGRSSEKLSPDQMELFDELCSQLDQLEQADEEPEGEEPPKESRRGKRKPLKERVPEDLPVEQVVIVPDEVQEAPELYKKIGEETVEELDVIPTQYFRRIIVREKYVLIDDREAAPVIAPAPERLIPNSYASAGLISQIILNKYCDHLPLYRQEWILKNTASASKSAAKR